MAEARYMDNPLRTFTYTGVFCLGIALVIWLVSDSASLWVNLAVSFSIGWSINLAFLLLGGLMQQFLNPYVAAIPITALGLCFGLTIGGVLITGSPWYFFQNDFSGLVLAAFFGIVGFVLFSTRARLEQTAADLARANLETERQERLVMETEIKLLQAQIEPHFLFNTLSNVAGLIRTDPEAAEETLHNLTTLLRSSLKRTREAVTTIQQELDIARAYLEIQKIRMQGRLEYTIDIDSSLNDVPLQPLLVQPLVENAIKHGIDPMEDGGTIHITTRANGPYVEIEIADTGGGPDTSTPTAGSGTGLMNVRKRLATLYGDTAQLVLSENSPRGMIACIKVPVAGT